MAIALTVPEAGGGRRTYRDERELSIGRDPDQVQVALSSAYVSRYHCVIRRRLNGDWVLIHRGRNPCRIGDITLRKPGEQALLPAHAELLVGGVKLLLEIDERDRSSQRVIQIEDLDIRDPESGLHLPVPGLDDDDEDDERTILDEEIPDLDGDPVGGADRAGEGEEPVPAPSPDSPGASAGTDGGVSGERTAGERARAASNDDADIVIFEGGRETPLPALPGIEETSRDLSTGDGSIRPGEDTSSWGRLWTRIRNWFR